MSVNKLLSFIVGKAPPEVSPEALLYKHEARLWPVDFTGKALPQILHSSIFPLEADFWYKEAFGSLLLHTMYKHPLMRSAITDIDEQNTYSLPRVGVDMNGIHIRIEEAIPALSVNVSFIPDTLQLFYRKETCSLPTMNMGDSYFYTSPCGLCIRFEAIANVAAQSISVEYLSAPRFDVSAIDSRLQALDIYPLPENLIYLDDFSTIPCCQTFKKILGAWYA